MVESKLKQWLPAAIVAILGGIKTYCRRMLRWARILVTVRGATVGDQSKLMYSALYAIVDSARGLGVWRDPKLVSDANLHVYGIGKFTVRGECDDLWHILPWREQSIYQAIRSRLSERDVFVDAGANVGFYSVLASRIVGPEGRVIACEMMPDTAEVLRKQIALNECTNIRVVEAAISANAGDEVSTFCAPGQHGQASIATDSGPRALTKISVRSTTLDDALESEGEIALLKMDLEGAEPLAIEGGSRTLNKTRAVIFEDRTDESGVTKQFERHGFKVERLDRANGVATRAS